MRALPFLILLGSFCLATTAMGSVWPFDCNYQDAEGVNHGVPEGPIAFDSLPSPTVLVGRCSLDLRGEEARVILPSDVINYQVGIIEGWFYPTSGDVDPETGNSGVLWDKSEGGSAAGVTRFSFNYLESFIRIQIDDDPSHSNTVYFNCSVPLNRWTHVAVAWNGSNVWLYVNCQEVGSTTLNAYPNGSARVSIGAAQDGGDDFDGFVDQVRFTPNVTTPWMDCRTIATKELSWGGIKNIYR